MLLNRTRTRIIGRKRKTPRSKLAILLFKIARATFEVLRRIAWINAQVLCRTGHQLRQTLRARMRNGVRVPIALLLDKAQKQILWDTMFARRFAGHLGIDTLVASFVFRRSVLGAPLRRCFNGWWLEAHRGFVLLRCAVIQNFRLGLEQFLA